MNSVFKNAAVIRHFKRYGLLPRLLALLLTSCLSLPQIYLPRRSQADHVTVLSKPFNGSPEQSLESLISIQSACASGPCVISHFSWLYLDTQGKVASNSSWFPGHGILFSVFALVAFFVMHLPVSWTCGLLIQLGQLLFWRVLLDLWVIAFV